MKSYVAFNLHTGFSRRLFRCKSMTAPSKLIPTSRPCFFNPPPALRTPALPWRAAVQMDGKFIRITVKVLRKMATDMQIPGRSKARRKADLVALIEKFKGINP
jgi:hypothetical protein